MQNIAFRVLALSALLVASGIAQAQSKSSGISWTYIEAAYQNTEFDLGAAGKPDGDGALLAGSLELGEFAHAFASWQNSSMDSINGVSLGDVGQYGIGFGFHTPLSKGDSTRLYSDRFSAFVNAQFLSTDVDNGSDSDGWGLDAGFRFVNFTAWEAIGSVGYEKFEHVDGELTLKGRLLFEIVRNLQLQGGVDWNDNRTQLFLGVRYKFPDTRLF